MAFWRKKKPWKYRYEPVGGIVALESPPALMLVDKDYLRARGVPDSPAWNEEWTGILSAPTEVHLALTNYCAAGCPACYMDSRPTERLETERADYELALSRIRELANMGVFHVALGGGETLEVPWLFELAAEMRRMGMVPNITTSGLALTEEKARACKVMGQVNVSVDGLGETFRASRGYDGFSKAEEAIALLKKNGVRVGVNCVISSKNYEHLDGIFAWARRTKLQDIEFLRYKPAGRGTELYDEYRLSEEQVEQFYPRITELTRKYRLRVKLDCSFGPFVYAHAPDPKMLEFFSVRGCEGGNWLGAVHPDGRAAPCSFAWDESIPVSEIRQRWHEPETFAHFKTWWNAPPEPCASCDYLHLCHGGCHVVAKHTDGSFEALDPECPKVRRYLRHQKTGETNA